MSNTQLQINTWYVSPGTGKTTLAHVLAAHCGFRVVEINASDDRTATSLTKRITDAAQMTHVLEGKLTAVMEV